MEGISRTGVGEGGEIQRRPPPRPPVRDAGRTGHPGPRRDAGQGPDGPRPPSWLEPFWDDSYLVGSDPIAINVNYFLALRDDPRPSRNTQVPVPRIPRPLYPAVLLSRMVVLAVLRIRMAAAGFPQISRRVSRGRRGWKEFDPAPILRRCVSGRSSDGCRRVSVRLAFRKSDEKLGKGGLTKTPRCEKSKRRRIGFPSGQQKKNEMRRMCFLLYSKSVTGNINKVIPPYLTSQTTGHNLSYRLYNEEHYNEYIFSLQKEETKRPTSYCHRPQ